MRSRQTKSSTERERRSQYAAALSRRRPRSDEEEEEVMGAAEEAAAAALAGAPDGRAWLRPGFAPVGVANRAKRAAARYRIPPPP